MTHPRTEPAQAPAASDRERVEAEAKSLYPADDITLVEIHMDDLMENYQGAFIAGRTATAAQVEAAAREWQRAYNEGVRRAPSRRKGITRSDTKKIHQHAMSDGPARTTSYAPAGGHRCAS